MTHKLLLADDSVTIQRVIELTFAGEDVQVVTVNDGEQAIARIPIEKPDIVLADIGMPRRSGYDVAAFVKDRPDLAHVPVVLLAGAFEPVDDERAKQVKCDGVLIKPFEPQQVIARVRELIDKRQAGGSAPQPSTSTPSAVAVARPGPLPGETHSPQEPRPPLPESPKPGAELFRTEIGTTRGESADSSLDDYFDRLDAAFATLGSAPGAAQTPPISANDLFGSTSPPTPAPDEGSAVPTLTELLGGSLRDTGQPPTPLSRIAPPLEPPDAPATLSAAPRPTGPLPPAPPGNVIAEAFSTLLAIEQGEAAPTALRAAAPAVQTPSASKVEITDALVDELTRRVLERLSPAAVRGVVSELVLDVAERLVREEIERIRSRQ